MSSRATATGVSFAAAPRASASRNSIAPAMRHTGTIFFTRLTTKLTSQRFGSGSMSPSCVVITCLTAVFGRTCCSTPAKFSTMTMAFAPESFSWCSSSRGVYSGLTFTTTMPARRMPNSATGYCSTLGDMIATRSPFASPGRPCRNAANARESASSSPYVIVRPRLWYAGLSANLAAVFSNMSATDPYVSGSMSAGMPAG